MQEILRPFARRGYFAVQLDDAQAAVARLPWVEHAEVRKRWPDVLEVVVVEHRPFARWGEQQLLSVEGDGVVIAAVKPATRGEGLVLHLERPGTAPTPIVIRPDALSWSTVTRPDLLERDDVPIGEPLRDGVGLTVDAPLTALRLSE